MKNLPRRKRRIVIISAGIVGAAICLSHNWFDTPQEANASPTVAVAAQVPYGSQAKPERVIGVKDANCKKCHESEVSAWMATKHYKADDQLGSLNGKKYATALGIKAADVHKNSICLNCHATKKTDKKGGNVQVFDYGVSCSSCHGGSGPVDGDGWLNPHGSYGAPNLKMEQEDPDHRKKRIAACEKAGMIRPARLHLLAKNCLSCHLVSNAKLVNAGHPSTSKGGFDLIAFTSGEVRHNFKMDKNTNAAVPSLWKKRTGGKAVNRKRMKFLIGILAELEAGVRILSTVPAGSGRSVFAKTFSKRVKGLKEDYLSGVIEALGDDAPEELEQLFEAADAVKLSSFNFKDAAGAKKALPTISKLTADIDKKYDGSKFAKLDEMIGEVVGKPRGKVFPPAQ